MTDSSSNRTRTRRWLAATVAALLVASVLSVVAGAPAQAANTSAEDKQDTNNDKVPDTRWFAGDHRYDTAEKLASKFAADSNGVSSLIIASGETEVDAVTAAGLAGSMNAPVLLTRRNSLPKNVSRYINNQNVANVTVVGGTAAVSEAVFTAIGALDPKPTVKRIAGDDRYATAAMIGSSLGGPSPTWCGSTQRAAILVNGAAEGWHEAVVAGPLAFRLGLPILLTKADELPAATRSFLVDNRVERVVIIGDTEAVSNKLRNSLIEDIGVVEAPRFSGATPAATSVAVAKEMRGTCASELNVDLERVALIKTTATTDGIAAAPVLGRGMGATGSIPVLLVGQELPAEVREFLAGTPNDRTVNGKTRKTHMGVVAVGGTAVVSEKVMADAVAAAKTSSELTATINFNPKTPTKFTVSFNDAVEGVDDPDTTAVETLANRVGDHVENPSMYRVNGRPLSANAATESARFDSSLLLLGNTVTITAFEALKTGDKIQVVGGGKVGANGDMRPLKGAEHTVAVPEKPGDTAAPKIEIVAVAGQSSFSIFVDEADPLLNPTGSLFVGGGVRIHCLTCNPTRVSLGIGFHGPRRENNFITGNQSDNAKANRPGAAASTGGGVFRYQVELLVPGTQTSRPLKVGEVIEVSRGLIRDKGNRRSPTTRLTAQAPKAEFRINEIRIGNKTPTRAASATIATGTAGTLQDDAKVTAKQTGIAAGSAGNAWKIFGYKLPTAVDSKPVDIEVDVDEGNKIITYTVRNGAPRLIHLGRALMADAKFAANFEVDFAATQANEKVPTQLLGTISPTAVNFGATANTEGKSAVALRVDFNDAVEDVHITNLANQILDVSTKPTDMRIQGIFGTLDRHVWITFESTEKDPATDGELPKRLGTRVIAGGGDVASNYHPTTNCGPLGVAPVSGRCPGDLLANGSDSDDLQSSVIRALRPDSSLKVFSLGTGSVASDCPTGQSRQPNGRCALDP